MVETLVDVGGEGPAALRKALDEVASQEPLEGAERKVAAPDGDVRVSRHELDRLVSGAVVDEHDPPFALVDVVLDSYQE
jgi:hypothetical protein